MAGRSMKVKKLVVRGPHGKTLVYSKNLEPILDLAEGENYDVHSLLPGFLSLSLYTNY